MENLQNEAVATVVQIDGGLTEKGNLKQATAREIREQGVVQFLDGFEKTDKGEYVLHVADVDGKPVYLKGNISVSISENLFDKPKASKSKAETEAPEIGKIFG